MPLLSAQFVTLIAARCGSVVLYGGPSSFMLISAHARPNAAKLKCTKIMARGGPARLILAHSRPNAAKYLCTKTLARGGPFAPTLARSGPNATKCLCTKTLARGGPFMLSHAHIGPFSPEGYKMFAHQNPGSWRPVHALTRPHWPVLALMLQNVCEPKPWLVEGRSRSRMPVVAHSRPVDQFKNVIFLACNISIYCAQFVSCSDIYIYIYITARISYKFFSSQDEL